MSRYIDADALIEAMGEEPYVWTDSAEEIAERNQWLTDMNIIENAPTIDTVSVVRGEWELVEPRYPIEQRVYWNKEQALADTKGNGAIEKRRCSCCGFIKNFMGHMKDEQFKLWNFCPNCGADMREREGL